MGHRILILAGAIELVSLSGLGWSPGYPAPFPGLVLFYVAFGAYLWAATRSGSDGSALGWIWAFAVLFRLSLLPLPPVLSDDIFRYLWDGHVQLSGINPFRYAPDDPALTALHTPWHGLINHPEVPTVYPPGAQGAFRLIAALGGTVLTAKLLWLVLDLATGAALIRVARATGRDASRVGLLYLWSPLLVVETAWSGHLEVLGLLWMTLLLLVLARSRDPSAPSTSATAGGLLALAALTKFAPAAALPSVARRLGPWSVVAFGLVAAAFYVPFLDVGSGLWTGLSTYVRDWRFNEGAFSVLELVTPTPAAARSLAAALVVAVVAWTVIHRYDVERSLFSILGAGLLLAPTVHPWYVLWILPFAALRQNRAFLLLTGLSFLGYWGLSTYHETGSWPQPGWLRALVWLPVWLVLALDALQDRFAADPGSAQGEADVA